jgi:hypothetical protein
MLFISANCVLTRLRPSTRCRPCPLSALPRKPFCFTALPGALMTLKVRIPKKSDKQCFPTKAKYRPPFRLLKENLRIIPSAWASHPEAPGGKLPPLAVFHKSRKSLCPWPLEMQFSVVGNLIPKLCMNPASRRPSSNSPRDSEAKARIARPWISEFRRKTYDASGWASCRRTLEQWTSASIFRPRKSIRTLTRSLADKI